MKIKKRLQNVTPVIRGSFESKSFIYKKGGFSNIEKVVGGIIIVLILIVMSPLLLGETFLSNVQVLEDFPVWFIPLILLIIGLGVAHLIKK